MERNIDSSLNWNLKSAVSLGSPGVIVENITHISGLPPCIRDGVTGIRYLKLRQLFLVSVDQVCEPSKQPGSITWADLAPTLKRERGFLNDLVRLFK